MFELKPLSPNSIEMALEKAKHYRLLNEPWQAESIFRDILNVEPNNQAAILNLILAISDQFASHGISSVKEAKKLCTQLEGEYQQKYYLGLIEERSGKVAVTRKTPRARYIAYEYYRRAMNYYEEAEKIRPEGNEDSLLRWNACVRAIQEYKLEPSPDDRRLQQFLDV